MKSSWWFRFTFLLTLVVVSVMMLLPTVFDFDEKSSYPVQSKINLGLDLQGGLYMIMGINFNKVYADEIKKFVRNFETILKEDKIKASPGELDVSAPEDPMHTLTLKSEADKEKAKNKIKQYYTNVVRLTGETETTLKYGLHHSHRNQIESQSVNKSIEVIRNRIDEFGVTEPEIISQGKDRIVVQLPGIKDISRAKALIGRTAKLEFKIVNQKVPQATLQTWVDKAEKSGITYKKGERFSDFSGRLNEFLKDDLPKGYTLVFQKKVNHFSNEIEEKVPFLVEDVANITGDDLQDAGVQFDQQKNQPFVSLAFKSAGSKLFEKVTGENVGKALAIILDENVYSAPRINEKIAGGRASITLGHGDTNSLMKQAKDIALILRAGALPVQLEFEEQRIVGPSLGSDSIEKAKMASMIGVIAIFLFILYYYRFSGLVAVVVLFLNVLFIMACLVGLEATLTLPGIAGIALTVGMAVDATIIIYERIREEVRKGLSNYKAVESGFSHAFWTIIDANITTALAGLCLLNFGTGPIRGFAVTLLIGICATVYTAYFVGQLLFELYMNKVKGRVLSI